ncbi:hypothetical protein L1987_84256 [Smallanthus sonchifolius]|uniref:Uncharacterized protein n=1 Tax=Smallanthus sonchifolius TaxID=185202 RepID=A0ACB8YE50_9ASTR|nr:hypothetical protein L1987_84256 [Smallanthus sonchifolius]
MIFKRVFVAKVKDLLYFALDIQKINKLIADIEQKVQQPLLLFISNIQISSTIDGSCKDLSTWSQGIMCRAGNRAAEPIRKHFSQSPDVGSQGLVVSAQGLGCMSMSGVGFFGSPKPEPDMINLIRHAIDSGVTFLDTSDFYGFNANEILIGKALKEGYREKVQIATKFGYRRIDGKIEVCGDPAYVRSACEASLKRLDIDCIDPYYAHRIDTRIPVEIMMGEVKKLVEEGKVKYVGLSEACASTIRRAHAVHPITAVQNEWSLWTRDLEDEIVPTCRMPRFHNMEHNKVIFEQVNEMATRKGCTAAQLALAWVHHQGTDVVPIPGTTKLENLDQNIGALLVKLTPEEIAKLESFAFGDIVKGERQVFMQTTWQNSETPPLSSWKGN